MKFLWRRRSKQKFRTDFWIWSEIIMFLLLLIADNYDLEQNFYQINDNLSIKIFCERKEHLISDCGMSWWLRWNVNSKRKNKKLID